MVIYSVNTALITSVLSIIIVVLSLTNFSMIVLLLGMPYGGIYILAMLSNLHTRSTLMQWVPSSETIPMPLSTIPSDSTKTEGTLADNLNSFTGSKLFGQDDELPNALSREPTKIEARHPNNYNPHIDA